MASHMDLEARLRALRASKGSSGGLPPASPSAAPAAPRSTAAPPSPAAPLVTASVDAVDWPEAPVAAGLPWPDAPIAKPRRASSVRTPVVLGDVMVMSKRSSVSSQSASSLRFQPPQQQQQQQSHASSDASTAASQGVSVASLLGPAYSEAVQIAQQAIENERSRNVNTAIDLYICAGQQLIRIGRQQHAAHLQTIVKKKALALLERAEGLSDWVNSVMAVDSSETAIDAAFAESQRANEQQLTEKEALVAKMKFENSEMSQKLKQLVLLTKVRARFRRVVSERRARKAEEALRRASLGEDSDNNHNDVEGNDEESQEDHRHDDTLERRSSVSSITSTSSSLSSSSGSHQPFAKQTPQQREVQKRDLINELHSRIGLPEISTLRKFTPLSEDATKDSRHVELEDELEAARLEAERLRAAVQEMEECFQATLEQTRQQSLKLKLEKEQNIAQMEDELERVRSELERERRLTASSFGDSNQSNQSSNAADDDDPDSYEDVAMIRSLRSSLHAIGKPMDIAAIGRGNNQSDYHESNEQSGGQRTSPVFKRGWSASESEGDSDVDEDGGVWL